MSSLRTLVLVACALAGPSAVRSSAAAEPATVSNTIEQRLMACTVCHGAKGEGLAKNEYYPRLAGKPSLYLYNQLINFHERRREFAIMTYLVGYLSESYLTEIADYYSKLQTPYPPPTTRATPEEMALGGKLVNEGDAARKVPACVSCHGKALTGLEPAIPGLVGLYPPYISAQMGAWKENRRHAMEPDCMHQVAQALTPADIGAITAWLVAQPVPADTRPAPAGSLNLPLQCGGLIKKQ